MAEAYLRHIAGGEFEVFSAGLFPEPINPTVFEVMEGQGISMQGQMPKSIDLFLCKEPFNYVIIVCHEGEAECPKMYPFALNLLRWPMKDPALTVGSKQYKLESFQKVFSEIKDKIDMFLDTMAIKVDS